MPVIQFESTVEGNLIRIPEQYIDTIRSGAKVTVRSYSEQTRDSESVKVLRTGFLKEQIVIPKDFDRMCEIEIEEIFGLRK